MSKLRDLLHIVFKKVHYIVFDDYKNSYTEHERDILRTIGWFFYETNQMDLLKDINISLIKYNEKTKNLTFFIDRPGLLIGRRGITIDTLIEFLKKNNVMEYLKTEIKTWDIIENKTSDYLYGCLAHLDY